MFLKAVVKVCYLLLKEKAMPLSTFLRQFYILLKRMLLTAVKLKKYRIVSNHLKLQLKKSLKSK